MDNKGKGVLNYLYTKDLANYEVISETFNNFQEDE